MAVIELDRLSKWYGEVIGLNNVSATVGSGITGLIGPNEAGKSTLMGLAMGQLRPSTGSIRLWGERVWNNPAILSRVGYCPEGDVFWPELTGQQFVYFLARASGLRRRGARTAAMEAIDLTGMREHMIRPIGTYSKGMRQRIKIAQALAHMPRLLILDEPFTGADPVARRDLVRLFQVLVAQDVDILISSHVLHEVEALTRQILMIDHGRIVAEGDLGDVRSQMHDRPHAIRVRVDQPRELASKLVGLSMVTGLQVTAEDTLIIETPVPEKVYDRLPEMVLAGDLDVREITAADAGLEAVFGYLTDRGA